MNYELNKPDRLLRMLEQPQRYSADEWQEILADEECRELYTLMSKTQSAIDAARADETVTDEMIEAEWQRVKMKNEKKKSERSLLKIAATFIGVLMLSGIAFAAISIALKERHPQPAKPGTRPDNLAACRSRQAHALA